MLRTCLPRRVGRSVGALPIASYTQPWLETKLIAIATTALCTGSANCRANSTTGSTHASIVSSGPIFADDLQADAPFSRQSRLRCTGAQIGGSLLAAYESCISRCRISIQHQTLPALLVRLVRLELIERRGVTGAWVPAEDPQFRLRD